MLTFLLTPATLPPFVHTLLIYFYKRNWNYSETQHAAEHHSSLSFLWLFALVFQTQIIVFRFLTVPNFKWAILRALRIGKNFFKFTDLPFDFNFYVNFLLTLKFLLWNWTLLLLHTPLHTHDTDKATWINCEAGKSNLDFLGEPEVTEKRFRKINLDVTFSKTFWACIYYIKLISMKTCWWMYVYEFWAYVCIRFGFLL